VPVKSRRVHAPDGRHFTFDGMFPEDICPMELLTALFHDKEQRSAY
jgi:hypothetical protein